MPGQPLVSIVTPTLNQGRFIEATIRSIRAQTYPHYEHIVVDGGSGDDTLDILRRHEGTYPMRWLSEPDEGMYDALNKGLSLCSGEVLAYLNSDDLYFPWTLEVIVEYLEAHPDTDLVYGDVLGVAENGREDLRMQPPYRYDFLLYAGSLVQPAVFWRAGVYESSGGFDTALGIAGDLDYWLRIGRSSHCGRIDEVLAIERDHVMTKRSSQRRAMLAESAAARHRAGAGSAPRRLVLRTLGRFRAWIAKRRLWLSFAVESRRARNGQPGRWPRFLRASRLRISPVTFTMSQLPWLGPRMISGVIDSGVDWLASPEGGASETSAQG